PVRGQGELTDPVDHAVGGEQLHREHAGGQAQRPGDLGGDGDDVERVPGASGLVHPERVEPGAFDGGCEFPDDLRVEVAGDPETDAAHALPPGGVSTTTVVALTTAVASEPGSRPSSSAASRLMRETTRNGPHCSSTCAMTPSAVTSVTSPVNRFRADRPTVESGVGRLRDASSWACRASAAPSTTFRPAPSTSAVSAPESSHRRTVSSLTPSRSAASLIRNCGMVDTVAPHLRMAHQFRGAVAVRRHLPRADD